MSAAEEARGRALALFDTLAEASPAKRAEVLAELARAEPEAAGYLARLLAADGAPMATPGPLDAGLLAGAAAAGGEEEVGPPEWAAGQRIGPWTLRERLAVGGMGEVWSAERAGEGFAQQAALKLLPRALGTGAAAARFRRERRILAALEHPGIARFIDGGVTADGVPYLAMERVDGTAITEHLARRQAPLDECLARFAEVCDAVAFAHRSLVVHRDLKPSNVFATADGRVKLLDFGIAKLLQDESATETAPDGEHAATLVTRLDERVMTPAYAAPEQIRGEPVTTATDVWALGVLLYEILTGERPFAGAGGRVELEQRVLRGDPERPSTRAAPPAVARRMRGDLDAIVLTALEKDPARRYASVAALADDLRAFLAERPVKARTAGPLHRAAKFVRRHRLAVGASAVAALGLAAGLGVALWQAREAARAGRRAEEVKAFLLRLFTVSSPEESRGERVTARELLDEGARRAAELKGEPELQVELYDTLARLYFELGLEHDSHRLAEQGLAAATQAFGARSVAAFDARLRLGQAALAIDARDEARRESAAATELATALASTDADAPVRAKSFAAELADADGRAADAVSLQREVVAALAGSDSKRRREEASSLAGYLFFQGDYAEAERMQRALLADVTRDLGELHPDTAHLHHQLGITLTRLDRSDEGLAELRRAVDIIRRVEGDSHPDLARSLHELATTLIDLQRFSEAAIVVDEGLAVARRARGERSYIYGNLTNDRAILAFHGGRYADAARDWEHVVALWNEILGAEHSSVLTVRSNLGALYERVGRLAEAEAAERAVLAVMRSHGPDVQRLGTLNTLGMILRQRGGLAEALALHREAQAIAERAEGVDGTKASNARVLAGRVELAAGNVAAAARDIDRATAAAEKILAADAPGLALYYVATAEVRLAEHRAEEALAAVEHSLVVRRKAGVQDSDPRVAEGRLVRGEVLAVLGRHRDARTELAAATATLQASYGPEHPLTRRAVAALAHAK